MNPSLWSDLSIRELAIGYVDLYLVHFPERARGDEWIMVAREDMVHFDMKSVWEGMEECHRLGLAKSIGVSNFTCKKLELLLSRATMVPTVNQEMSIFLIPSIIMK